MPGAWTSPVTWTPGQVVTDTNLNSALRDNLLWLGGTAGVITQALFSSSTTAASTASASLVLVPNISVAITTIGVPTLILYGGAFANTAAGNGCSFAVMLDASSAGTESFVTSPGINYAFNATGALLHTPTAAAHLYQVGWATSGGTLSVSTSAAYWLAVLEFRR